MSRVERIITTKKTPGVRFRQARELLNLKQNECAETLGLEWYTLRDIESGKKKMTPEMAINMENLFSVNFRWLLTGQGPMFLDHRVSQSQVSEPPDSEVAEAMNVIKNDVMAQKIAIMLGMMDESERRNILARAEEIQQRRALETKVGELEGIIEKMVG